MAAITSENCKKAFILNLDKLHTTALGAERIKRNLSLNEADVVRWCREQINQPGSETVRKGKNWYVTTGGCVLTINAYSFTIITAHKRKTAVDNLKTGCYDKE